ncbi:MAG: amino acid permease [Acidimicrobiia bacterium]|nr:amino acid permease [Acidimicrobiia bacterium]NND13657.1 amino acid permease [Acidimicrobiia bacterium]
MNTETTGRTELTRELSLSMLILYGLGTTIGAGIYALTGEVAGAAGLHAPISFLVAALLAGITGLAFAELAGRLPRAAGEAVFVDHAFGRKTLTRIIGLSVVLVGLIAGAAITTAFAGYLGELFQVPDALAMIGLIVSLGVVSATGARSSVLVAALFTVVEVIGLSLIVVYGVGSADFGLVGTMFTPDLDAGVWFGILGGAFVAFFAFLGFEDIDAMAEETRDPTRVLPKAILGTLAISTVFYVVVVGVAVLVVDPSVLGRSDAPLVLVFDTAGGSADLMAALGTLAMINGVLVQLIMVSRVLYGMGRLGSLPGFLGVVEPRTGIPMTSTLIAVASMLALALAFDLGVLARLTSLLTIGIFTAVNVSLVRIKDRDGPPTGFRIPRWAPILGAAVSALLLVGELLRQITV